VKLFFGIIVLLLLQSCSLISKLTAKREVVAHEPAPAARLTLKPPKKQQSADLLSGWDPMIATIKQSYANPRSLNGRSFTLHAKIPGRWNLYLFPEKAFKVTSWFVDDFQEYRVDILAPEVLYQTESQMLKLSEIRAELIYVTSEKGDLFVDAQTDCLYRVRFKQGHKDLSFGQLAKDHRYRFIISDPNQVQLFGQFGDTVVFQRSVGNYSKNPVSVQLEMIDKDGQQRYNSSLVWIPLCVDYQEKEKIPGK